MKEKLNKIKEVTDISLKNLSELVYANTIIGEPIKFNDDIIIPISKLSLGIVCGGGEYGKISILKKNTQFPYSAGNLSAISVKPCGFLYKNKNASSYTFLTVEQSSYDKLFDKCVNILDKIYEENKS